MNSKMFLEKLIGKKIMFGLLTEGKIEPADEDLAKRKYYIITEVYEDMFLLETYLSGKLNNSTIHSLDHVKSIDPAVFLD